MRNKRKQAVALALAAALCLSLSIPAEAAGGFLDVAPGAYYAEAVDWAVEQGIAKGVSETAFAPDQTCTRGQIVTFLWRAAGSPPVSSDDLENLPVQDISRDDFFCDAVIWAKRQGAFEGDSFLPQDPCTRLAAAELIYGCFSPQWARGAAPKAGFSDTASEAVDWTVARGVVKGVSESAFAPDQICTRGQIVAMLYRERTFDPLGSYIHESQNFRLELSQPGKQFALYITQAYLDDPAIPLDYKPVTAEAPLVRGTLAGSPYRWAWDEIFITFYEGYAIVEAGDMDEEYPGISGKYILQPARAAGERRQANCEVGCLTGLGRWGQRPASAGRQATGLVA